MELKEFLKKIPVFLYPVCTDAKDVSQARHLILLETDFYTDEPMSERENCFIKTNKQYNKALAIAKGA